MPAACTRTVLDAGLRRARFTGRRSQLQSQLGRCLVLLGQLDHPATNAAALFADALTQFQAAEAADPSTADATVCQLWAVALLRQGQHTKDKMLIRQGIERLLRTLELQPDTPRAHYYLCCCYAQLRQFDQATRHLLRALHHDPRGSLYHRSQTDPDLRALRQSTAFQRQFRPRPADDPSPTRPTISVK